MSVDFQEALHIIQISIKKVSVNQKVKEFNFFCLSQIIDLIIFKDTVS